MGLYLLIILPPLAFMIYAQWRVSSAYSRYGKVTNMAGITGMQAAQRLLTYQGLANVRVELTKGKLTDNYDPRDKVLRLSPDVANRDSVAALGIVAHEVGHAAQDAGLYAPMRVRTAIFPVANIGSQFGFILVFIGLMLYGFSATFGLTLAWVGVWLFAAAVIFSLVTLPVEFNASTRARQMLRATAMVSTVEYDGASAVLSAAALTYVAALLQAMAQLLYFVLMVLGLGGRRS